jgi:hypothetical protein
MIKLASIALAATLGLSALGSSKPASAGVVVGVGVPVPALRVAPAVHPYAYAGRPYYPAWGWRYPYGYLGYSYGWHPGYGWRPGYGWHPGYAWHSGYGWRGAYRGGRVARGWHR